ncbi:MAG: hypothetical protein QXH30_00485 [Candidatus Bilamarchaeaceae archaeon]
MDAEIKKQWEHLFEKKVEKQDINIVNKLKKDPLRAISYLARKFPSLYIRKGLRVEMKTFWGGE